METVPPLGYKIIDSGGGNTVILQEFHQEPLCDPMGVQWAFYILSKKQKFNKLVALQAWLLGNESNMRR